MDFTFELKFKAILKAIFQSKNISKVKYQNSDSKSKVTMMKCHNQNSKWKVDIKVKFKVDIKSKNQKSI